MATIHLFNPETDYALALGNAHYNPPASIIELRKKMALFPASYANPNDAILILDKIDLSQLRQSPYYNLFQRKNLRLITLADLNRFNTAIFKDFNPWGWNHSLRNKLLASGMPEQFLKSAQEIDDLRKLAHRRTTIPFMEHLARNLPHIKIAPAREFNNVEDALHFSRQHVRTFFKAPWSSSGRGVICSTDLNNEKLSQWIKGFIHKQGSVIGEVGYDRALDFASEWTCHNGEVTFIGLSIFHTTKDGKYLNNVIAPRQVLEREIANSCHEWGQQIIQAQKEALRSIISPKYNGPVGIDMLSTLSGHINPCIEINLRQTMGLASINIQSSSHYSQLHT